ncbi:MAG TPA: hypothetical protein PKA76_09850 [Pirellulaceae bacterium]|nr:hypothetical protein [Pirellulaceae bacterium]
MHRCVARVPSWTQSLPAWTSKTQKYSDVVAAVAVETEPEPEEVDRILARANKSVGNLKADTEAMLAEREVNIGDREHRREKSTSHGKQAESLRRRIAANEKSRPDLLRKREQVEQRLREV